VSFVLFVVKSVRCLARANHRIHNVGETDVAQPCPAASIPPRQPVKSPRIHLQQPENARLICLSSQKEPPTNTPTSENEIALVRRIHLNRVRYCMFCVFVHMPMLLDLY